MKRHSEHRLQVARITRSIYRECRNSGWTPKAARKNAEETIAFVDSIQMLALKHDCGVR